MGMLLILKYVSISLILSDCVRFIYIVNAWGTILVLTSFSRVCPTSYSFRPSPLDTRMGHISFYTARYGLIIR
jgi:hypothetical protein